jgi:hypothetical protein
MLEKYLLFRGIKGGSKKLWGDGGFRSANSL